MTSLSRRILYFLHIYITKYLLAEVHETQSTERRMRNRIPLALFGYKSLRNDVTKENLSYQVILLNVVKPRRNLLQNTPQVFRTLFYQKAYQRWASFFVVDRTKRSSLSCVHVYMLLIYPQFLAKLSN